jgi:transposase
MDKANAGQTPGQAPQGTAREPANGTDAVGTQDGLIGDGDRRDPAVDRNAVVAELADQIRDAVRAGDRWRPDYAQMMAATGRKRSWCEKVVRSARSAVLEVPARTDHDVHTDVMRRRYLTPPNANTTPRP